jgi:ABC-type arginine transport system permease subunit
MSKRMQVVVDDAELERYEETARALGLTLSEWVRQALRGAATAVSHGDIDSKLSALERATGHSFPAPDIDDMLAEIELGYVHDPTA